MNPEHFRSIYHVRKKFFVSLISHCEKCISKMLSFMSCPDFKFQQLLLKMFLEIYLCALFFSFSNTETVFKTKSWFKYIFSLVACFFWVIKFWILM